MDAPTQGETGRPDFLDASGYRTKIQPADVKGRFLRWRRIVYAILILHYLALPFIKNGEHLSLPRFRGHRVYAASATDRHSDSVVFGLR